MFLDSKAHIARLPGEREGQSLIGDASHIFPEVRGLRVSVQLRTCRLHGW